MLSQNSKRILSNDNCARVAYPLANKREAFGKAMGPSGRYEVLGDAASPLLHVRFRTAVCKPIYLLNCFKVLLTKPFQGTVWSRASGCPCSETALLWLD